jgi:peptide subunit release factor 1 (eRF1)
MNGFVDCRRCNVWSDIPAGFDERKKLAQCPKCNQPMFLNRSMDAVKDLAYNPKNKVLASLMSHRN